MISKKADDNQNLSKRGFLPVFSKCDNFGQFSQESGG